MGNGEHRQRDGHFQRGTALMFPGRGKNCFTGGVSIERQSDTVTSDNADSEARVSGFNSQIQYLPAMRFGAGY